MDQLAELLGRLHPVILHFPLALLVVGSVLELFRCFRDSPFLEQAVRGLLGLGAIAALIAAGSGWLLAAHEHIRSDQRLILELHRWIGLAAAVWAVAAWWSARAWGDAKAMKLVWGRRAFALVTLVLITAAGHFGAALVWGNDWFSLNPS
ncbi:MAG TPA: DUF2231 domain-containing protein [Candidatus Didemnitutus sp.]|jgi:uncharacterized membrane protein|nr:DUF2231 domain-containing protein [Candidatus Didemnitutus sp.]